MSFPLGVLSAAEQAELAELVKKYGTGTVAGTPYPTPLPESQSPAKSAILGGGVIITLILVAGLVACLWRAPLSERLYRSAVVGLLGGILGALMMIWVSMPKFPTIAEVIAEKDPAAKKALLQARPSMSAMVSGYVTVDGEVKVTNFDDLRRP